MTYAKTRRKRLTNFLSRLKRKLNVNNSVIKKTMYFFNVADETGLVRGSRSIEVLLSAAFYAACHETRTALTLYDIAKATSIRRMTITNCYKLFESEQLLYRIYVVLEDPDST